MALYVNTNVSSLNSQRKLANSTLNLNTSYQRMASGLRINTAKDDAAGLQISNRLSSQINGLDQGCRNSNDGLALAQTVEGALDETTSMLQRIRTLAVQASNGTNTQADRESIQSEVNSFCEEISRIAQKTTYAGAQVLDGAGNNSLLNDKGHLIFQIGADAGDILSLDLSQGFQMSQIAKANSLNIGKTLTSGLVSAAVVGGKEKTAYWNVLSFDAAQDTLAKVDKFIEFVDAKRSELGAIQNRMESHIRNISNVSEQESDSRSRMRDTDFASESASLTQNNILQNASQTILAQANQRPSIVSSLLR